MRDDDNSVLAGLLEHRLDRLDRERHDADGVDALSDKVLDNLDLRGRIGLARANLPSVLPGVGLELLHALAHPVEPGDAVDLDDGRDRVSLPRGLGGQIGANLGRVERSLRIRRRQGHYQGNRGARQKLEHRVPPRDAAERRVLRFRYCAWHHYKTRLSRQRVKTAQMVEQTRGRLRQLERRLSASCQVGAAASRAQNSSNWASVA